MTYLENGIKIILNDSLSFYLVKNIIFIYNNFTNLLINLKNLIVIKSCVVNILKNFYLSLYNTKIIVITT